MSDPLRDTINKYRYFIAGCFLLLSLYLIYIVVARGDSLSQSSGNPRLWIVESRVLRGGIYDRQGEALAVSTGSGDQNNRSYPFGPLYAHIIGYDSRRLGKTGLEKAYDAELLGLKGSLVERLSVRWGLKGVRGNDLYLTIDNRLQQRAWDLLSPYTGAAVVLNPQTGEILALVSTPSFDPNEQSLENQWDKTSTDPGRPLLDRATQGLYPPGSTMKIVTASIGLVKDPGLPNETYDCTGEITIQGRVLHCWGVHGVVDLNSALAVSCDTYFAHLGLNIGSEDFTKGLESFGWGDPLSLDLPVSQVPLYQKSLQDPNGLAESAIGQGRILATPLYMALVDGAIANGGVMMQPYLVQQIRDPGSGVIWTAKPRVLRRVTSPQVADQVKQAMVGVVNSGTGTVANIPGLEVAGKTGSAENPGGAPHSWFVAFAPASNPQVAVCVMVEHGGEGSQVAGPIARQLIQLALSQGG
jgi:peptidoglycan glycosyltransferase